MVNSFSTSARLGTLVASLSRLPFTGRRLLSVILREYMFKCKRLVQQTYAAVEQVLELISRCEHRAAKLDLLFSSLAALRCTGFFFLLCILLLIGTAFTC